jgi:hypothetical protein
MLTNQVEESLKEAEGYLRNALHWAAKNERPAICTTISKMIQEIENLQTYDKLIDKLESRMEGDSGSFGSFFS